MQREAAKIKAEVLKDPQLIQRVQADKTCEKIIKSVAKRENFERIHPEEMKSIYSKEFEELKNKGKKIRVVNMFSVEIFEKQSTDYKENVLPESLKKRLVVEAGSSFGWHKYAKDSGIIISVDRFGESAPGNVVLEKFGFTSENIVNSILKHY